MKVAATTALLLAITGSSYAMPVPVGLLNNVQDDCSTSSSSSCVPASQFLHHLVASDTKYMHLIHPGTGAVMGTVPVPASDKSNHSSTPEPEAEEEAESTTGKAAAGAYPNHPAGSTPFKSGETGSASHQLTMDQSGSKSSPSSGSTGTSSLDKSHAAGAAATTASSTGADGHSSDTKGGVDPDLMAPVHGDDPGKTATIPSSTKASSTDGKSSDATTPKDSVSSSPSPSSANATATPDKPTSKDGGLAPIPSELTDDKKADGKADSKAEGSGDKPDVKGAPKTADAADPTKPANATDPTKPANATDPTKPANATDPAKAGNTTAPLPPSDKAAPNTTTAPIPDATGVAQVPNIVGNADGQHMDGALGNRKDILMPLCTIALAAAGAVFLL